LSGVGVRIEGEELQELPAKVRERVLPEFVRLSGEYILSRMVSYAPVRTGALYQSISYRVDRSEDHWRLEVGVGVPYAPFVVYGTAPHLIMPVNASVLRFETAEGVVYARYVWHPGTRPNPFTARAVADYMEDEDELWKASFEEEFRG